jgi:hypothetical protein
MHDAFPASQRVTELLARCQRGRAGGEDFEVRKNIGADFKQPTGVFEVMDLVEDDNRLVAAFEEQGRVLDGVFGFREVTVDVVRLIGTQALGDGGLA